MSWGRSRTTSPSCRGTWGSTGPTGRRSRTRSSSTAWTLRPTKAAAGLPDGCTLGTTVESPLGLDPHELVHAYLSSTGFPPTVLVEGVAVALACQSSLFAQKPTQTWDQLASAGYGAGDAVYYAGTWLVGYLLDVYGPRSFLTLYRTLSSTADAATMDAAFRTIYGVEPVGDLDGGARGESAAQRLYLAVLAATAGARRGAGRYRPACAGSRGRSRSPWPRSRRSRWRRTGSGFSVKPCGQVPLPNRLTGASGRLGSMTCQPGSYFVDVSPDGRDDHGKIGRLGGAQPRPARPRPTWRRSARGTSSRWCPPRNRAGSCRSRRRRSPAASPSRPSVPTSSGTASICAFMRHRPAAWAPRRPGPGRAVRC